MSDGIVPLRRRGEERSAIARIDAAAVDMLVGGRATSLQAARAKLILADLRGREPTGEAQIDEANANLIAAINQGIVQIDLFVVQARTYAEGATLACPHPVAHVRS